MRLTFQIHAHQEALELALVGDADLDRLAAAIGGDGAFERRTGETHHHAQRGGVLRGSLAEGLDGGGADFGVRVGRERREVRRRDAEVTERVHGLAADISIRVGKQALGERSGLLALFAEDPEGLDAAGGGSRGVFDDRGQRGGGRRLRSTIGEGLPSEVRVRGHLRPQASDQVRGRELRVVGHGRRDEALGLDAPDAAGLLVAVGVIAGDLVMADDLVVPIDDVEATIRPHRHRDRAEERVVAADEVVELLEAITRAFAVLADRVHLRGDRIGDVHHAVVALRPDADVGERQAAEARAPHLEIRGLDGERRLVGLRQTVSAAGVERVFMERHHRITIVIGFLDERLAFAGEHESPDIAGTRRGGLEETAVRTEAGHARAREIGDLALGRGDLAGIERALGEPEPTEGRAGELVREEVRVLDAEARQQDLASVGLAVAVGVAQEDDVVTVLDDGAILVRQDALGNGEAVGESARLTHAGLERLVEDDHLVAGLGLIERLGRGGILIGVDRVFQRRAGPRPALLVEDQHDELAEVGGLLGEELDLEAFGELEQLLLLLGRTSNPLDVVIARVFLRRGGRLGRRGLLRLGLHLVPGQRTGRRRQFFDRDVLGLDHGHAARMDLEGDPAIGGDVRLGLDVIERRHAVDPAAEAVPLGEDAVFVPLAFLDGGEHGGGVLGVGDDLVAAALVVKLAIPAFAVVHLVAGHLGTVRHAHAAHLHAAVHEARAGEAELHAEVEVLIGLLGREEEVLRHLDRGRAAADLAVLDAPPGGVAFPARQGLAIEEGDRGRVRGQSQEQSEEATHG